MSLTAADVLACVAEDRPVPGRHLVLVAHPDDEVISASAALCCLENVVVVQLTEDTAEREQERREAQEWGGWSFQVLMGGRPFREAHQDHARLYELVRDVSRDADVLWTHPYEGGHIDHDTAAWIGQAVGANCLRLEFASYHATETGQTFGDFWPDAEHPTVTVTLHTERWARKVAALQAYSSQAHILRKFPYPQKERYREAPLYDFSRPAPPPRSRWDVKGYQPSTAIWRQWMERMTVS